MIISSSSLPVDATFRSPNDSMEYPIHAKSKPKFTKAYSFGLVTGLPYIGHSAHREPFAWSDFFPQFLSSTSRTGSQKICNSSGKRWDWQCSDFGIALSPESDDRLEANIDRLLSEHGIDPAQFDNQEEKKPRADVQQPNQRSAPDRAVFRSQVVTPTPKTTSLFGTPSLRLHSAAHVTQHSKKRQQIGLVFGISPVLISCNLRDTPKCPTQFRLESRYAPKCRSQFSWNPSGRAEASEPKTTSIRRRMTTSTTDHSPVTGDSRAVASRDGDRHLARETKPSFKTTELIVYVLSVLGVLIASLVVDVNEDGQGFSAYQGWFLVTLLTIGYLISRGLAKSGSRDDTR